jgi:hypothetical protein
MTVKELRDRLSKFDDKTSVVVYAEDETVHQFFEVDDISIATGSPCRLENGRAGFSFTKDGPVSWLFITVTAA